jgi:DNA-binding transcriptional MerR regulator
MHTFGAMTSMNVHAPAVGIAEVSKMSGLSADTLRWYEEGLVPRVPRSPDGRRSYTDRDVAMVVMLARLRESGMPVEEMREFARLVAGGAATHGRRLAVLERHRERIHERMAALETALDVLDDMAAHYRRLISEGLDCDENPVSADTAALQRKGLPA